MQQALFCSTAHLGLVKVETQTGGVEGDADEHNNIQFFTKNTPWWWTNV